MGLGLPAVRVSLWGACSRRLSSFFRCSSGSSLGCRARLTHGWLSLRQVYEYPRDMRSNSVFIQAFRVYCARVSGLVLSGRYTAFPGRTPRGGFCPVCGNKALSGPTTLRKKAKQRSDTNQNKSKQGEQVSWCNLTVHLNFLFVFLHPVPDRRVTAVCPRKNQ